MHSSTVAVDSTSNPTAPDRDPDSRSRMSWRLSRTRMVGGPSAARRLTGPSGALHALRPVQLSLLSIALSQRVLNDPLSEMHVSCRLSVSQRHRSTCH